MRKSSGGCVRGGKKPTARSIKQDFETFFESFKIRTAWRKDFFDTLRGRSPIDPRAAIKAAPTNGFVTRDALDTLFYLYYNQ